MGITEDTAAQRPRWFVSHWWGEPVKDFVRALKKHAEERELFQSGHTSITGEHIRPQWYAYWVCAYANNQHDLGAEITADPKDSAFFKAMQECEGVVVVLDEDATPFTRIWCCFEQAVAVQGKKLLLDFVTVHQGFPQLLTDGLSASDQLSSSYPPAREKTLRESEFPLNLIEKGYTTIRVQDAEASVPDDKTRILDSIALNEQDREEAYDRVNRRLRALLAKPAVSQSAKKGSLKKAIDVICADTDVTEITVDLTWCDQLTDITPLAALRVLKDLKHLTLIFNNCRKLEDLAPLEAICDLQNLEQVTMDFCGCKQLSDLKPLQALRHLELRALHGGTGLVIRFTSTWAEADQHLRDELKCFLPDASIEFVRNEEADYRGSDRESDEFCALGYS